jgi:hypothetical protein
MCLSFIADTRICTPGRAGEAEAELRSYIPMSSRGGGPGQDGAKSGGRIQGRDEAAKGEPRFTALQYADLFDSAAICACWDVRTTSPARPGRRCGLLLRVICSPPEMVGMRAAGLEPRCAPWVEQEATRPGVLACTARITDIFPADVRRPGTAGSMISGRAAALADAEGYEKAAGLLLPLAVVTPRSVMINTVRGASAWTVCLIGRWASARDARTLTVMSVATFGTFSARAGAECQGS